jgi:hypothetical protein
LAIMGAAVATAINGGSEAALGEIARHPSDLVRQWGAYAVNHTSIPLTLSRRLSATLPYAADLHMSVRECAWMAFRPHLATALYDGLSLLEPVTRSACPSERRFAIEVSRPRSVWGRHIEALKRNPSRALSLLENVYDDEARYVRLAVGKGVPGNNCFTAAVGWVR